MIYGSPIVSSTPGGIEIGVRPSLDGRAVDAENGLREVVEGALASAGTRKEGSVTIGDDDEAGLAQRAATRDLLGASMVAAMGVVGKRSRCPSGVARACRSAHSLPMRHGKIDDAAYVMSCAKIHDPCLHLPQRLPQSPAYRHLRVASITFALVSCD